MAQNKEHFKVSDYEFKNFSLSASEEDLLLYEFKDLSQISDLNNKVEDKVLKIEREFAKKSNFEISPIVREFRGLNRQESEEKEREIKYRVEKRVAEVQQNAFKLGQEEGISQGRKEVIEQTKLQTEEKLQEFADMINFMRDQRNEIIDRQKTDIYKIVKDLTKWVILRELKDDDNYLQRLLEKLILEIQTKSDLIVKVSKDHFEKMPEVIQSIESKLGQLPNLRVEIDYDLEGHGMILDCENGIIAATLDEQFKSIDKLFESLGIVDHE